MNALEDMEARKDAAYLERNQCVALVARMAVAMGLPVAVTNTAIEGWSEDWHGCIYICLPTGQVSWHFHDSHAHLFAGLPQHSEEWDGHDTQEKYRRVNEAFKMPNVGPEEQNRKDTGARKMKQSRKHSALEATINICIGYLVAILAQIVIFPFYGLEVTVQGNLEIGAWFTLISFIRSYVLRRVFTCWRI